MLQKSPMYAYLPARDVARARQFYEGVLGFAPAREVAGGVVYECGQGTAGGAKAAWFRDSEGNIMAVIQTA